MEIGDLIQISPRHPGKKAGLLKLLLSKTYQLMLVARQRRGDRDSFQAIQPFLLPGFSVPYNQQPLRVCYHTARPISRDEQPIEATT